jgi:hypothetical protein
MATRAGTVEVDVRYDRANQMQLATQGTKLSREVANLKIEDQASVDRANEIILRCKQWIESVDRIMDPVRDATHKAWKAAIKAQDEFKEPVLKPMAQLKAAVTKFIVDAQAEADRKQRLADEEQARLNRAEAKRVAEELEALGATKAEIKEAKQEIKATPAPTVAPVAETSAGQSIRMLYSAEVTDMRAFIKHLAEDEYLLTLFWYSQSFKKAVESELRGEATHRKDKYSIPGTRLIKTPSGAWRG